MTSYASQQTGYRSGPNDSTEGAAAPREARHGASALFQERPQELVRGALVELASLDQWVPWKHVMREGRQDKPPHTLNADGTGLRLASHSRPGDWMSRVAALAAAEQFGGAGVGFVFTEHDPYSGIDLDGCRDPLTGMIEPWAQRIIDLVSSYTEISPTKTGVKLIVRGTLPESIKHTLGPHKGIEIYSQRRYFTITGEHLAGTPLAIRDAQAALDALARELRPPRPPKTETQPPTRKITPGEAAAEDLSFQERLRLAGEYIRAHYDLTAELEAAGAVKIHTGYSCPFCKHTHTTTLTIAPGGKVGYSHSPNCKLYDPQGFDVTNVLMLTEGCDRFDQLARKLAPHLFPQRTRQAAPLPEPPLRYQTEEQARDAERKRTARRQESRAILDDNRARFEADSTLPERARRLYRLLMEAASDSLQCSPTNAKLMTQMDTCKRTVQRAFADLEQGGYGKRSGGFGGAEHPERNKAATWTFARVTDAEQGSTHVSPYMNHEESLIPDSLLACKGRGDTAPLAASEPDDTSAADDLDTWQWAEDGHSADDLTLALGTAPPSQAPAPESPRTIAGVSEADEWAEADRFATAFLAKMDNRPPRFTPHGERWYQLATAYERGGAPDDAATSSELTPPSQTTLDLDESQPIYDVPGMIARLKCLRDQGDGPKQACQEYRAAPNGTSVALPHPTTRAGSYRPTWTIVPGDATRQLSFGPNDSCLMPCTATGTMPRTDVRRNRGTVYMCDESIYKLLGAAIRTAVVDYLNDGRKKSSVGASRQGFARVKRKDNTLSPAPFLRALGALDADGKLSDAFASLRLRRNGSLLPIGQSRRPR